MKLKEEKFLRYQIANPEVPILLSEQQGISIGTSEKNAYSFVFFFTFYFLLI